MTTVHTNTARQTHEALYRLVAEQATVLMANGESHMGKIYGSEWRKPATRGLHLGQATGTRILKHDEIVSVRLL